MITHARAFDNTVNTSHQRTQRGGVCSLHSRRYLRFETWDLRAKGHDGVDLTWGSSCKMVSQKDMFPKNLYF